MRSYLMTVSRADDDEDEHREREAREKRETGEGQIIVYMIHTADLWLPLEDLEKTVEEPQR